LTIPWRAGSSSLRADNAIGRAGSSVGWRYFVARHLTAERDGAAVSRNGLGLGLSLSLVCLAGCAVGPDFKTPPAPPASAYGEVAGRDLGDPGRGEGQQKLVAGTPASAPWWTAFNSPELDRLERAALANNQTLAAARANLTQARDAEAQARGALYPQLDFGATASRLKTSLLPEGINQLGPVTNDFTIGPSVSYLLDPFGGQHRLREQKRALAEYQAFEAEGAGLAVTGGVARTLIDSTRVRDQIEALEALARDDERTLDGVGRLAALQLRTVADVEAARSQLASDRALLPPLRQQLAIDQDALAILVGKTPGEATSTDLRLEALTLPGALPLSVPADLVRQRPDVRAAEAQLHAASAAIGVATAQLYPSFNLSGAITQESLSTSNLFTADATGGFLAASLAAPILHGGALRAQRREAVDAYDAAYAAYRQSVLTACGQVSDVLHALDHDAQLLQSEQQSVDAAGRALAAAQAQYAVARIDLLRVLQAQRDLGRAQLALIAARAQRYLDTVQLFAAIGGTDLR
jgi:NodT family efflux transporter outer membrane factor (OMF) lipoprotein